VNVQGAKHLVISPSRSWKGKRRVRLSTTGLPKSFNAEVHSPNSARYFRSLIFPINNPEWERQPDIE